MKKLKPLPSRIKYENNNPTVSARLPKEKRDKLLAILLVLKMTLAQLLLHFIGEYEIKIIPVEEASKQGFDEGYKKGFLRAKEMYAVRYPCNKCGKEIVVNSEKEKQDIRQFMIRERWCHGECLDNK